MKIEINGANLFLNVQGEPGATPIIAHHGAPGLSSHAEPSNAMAPLADERQIVTFDARGSGTSDLTPPFTHAQWVADVDALREHFGFEKFIMAGGSYGGFISLEYALAHPDRVTHVILRDTSASFAFNEIAKKNALSRAAEFPDITEEVLDRMFDGRLRDDEDYRELYTTIAPLYDVNYNPEKTRERMRTAPVHAVTHNAAFAHSLPTYDLRDRLAEITVPVLITVGRYDWITPVEASEEIHSLLPNSELMVFENSGHSPQVEENELWVATIRDFLRRHS